MSSWSSSRSFVVLFLFLFLVVLCVVPTSAYPSPDELYNVAKEYRVEHTDPHVPIVWVFYGSLLKPYYYQDYSAVYVIQRGDEIVGFVLYPQANFWRQSSIEKDVRKRLRFMRDCPEHLGDIFVHASYQSPEGDDYYEAFRSGLGDGFSTDEAKIVYLDPRNSKNTFKLPVEQDPKFKPVQFDSEDLELPVRLSSFKRYFSVDSTCAGNSYGDVQFLRRGHRIIGVEIIPHTGVRSDGSGFSDDDAKQYMRARLADLEKRTLTEGNKTKGLRFVFNDHGHALIYNPELGGPEYYGVEPFSQVIARGFPNPV